MKKSTSILLVCFLILTIISQGISFPAKAQGEIVVDPVTRTIENDFIKISWDTIDAERISGLYLKAYSTTYNLVGNHPWEYTGNAYYYSYAGGTLALVGASNTNHYWNYEDYDDYVIVKILSSSFQGVDIYTEYAIKTDSPAIYVNRYFEFSDTPIETYRLAPYTLRAYSRNYFTTFAYPKTDGTIALNTAVCESGCEDPYWNQTWIDIEAPALNVGLGLVNLSGNPPATAWMDRDGYSYTSYTYGAISGIPFDQDLFVSYVIFPHLGNYSTVSWDSLVTPPLGDVDLSIADIQPTQVLETTDLILGKPLAVRVLINDNGFATDPFTQLTPITVAAVFQGVFSSKTVQLRDLTNPVDFIFDVADSDFTNLLVFVDPYNDIAETDEYNNDNSSNPVQTTIQNTKGLSIVFIKVECFGTLNDYYDTVAHGSQFVLGQWPISSEEFSYTVSETTITTCGDTYGDDFKLLQKAGRKENRNANNFIGIVDDAYFENRGNPEYWGLTNKCGGNLHLVRDGAWSAVAHEIAHSYNLDDTFADYCKIEGETGPQQGYWVEQEIPINVSHSLMDGVHTGDFPYPSLWIGFTDYQTILKHHLDR